MNTHRGRILIAFAIVYLVWGSTYLAIRVAVESIPPFTMAGIRNLVAGILLLRFAHWRRGGTPQADTAPRAALWRTAVIMGFLMFMLGNALLSWTETRIDSGLAALIVGAIPLWVVVLARFNPWGAHKAITPQRAVGVAVGIVGLALLVWPGAAKLSGVRMDLLATAVLLVGSLGWSVGTVLAPSLVHPKDKLEGSGMTMLVGGAMIITVAAVRGELATFNIAEVSGRSLLALGYLVVFGSMIAYSAYVYLVAHCEATTVATYALVNPIVAVFLGWAFVGEVVTPRMIVATGIIIAGLALTLFGGQAAAWAARQARSTGTVIRQAML